METTTVSSTQMLKFARVCADGMAAKPDEFLVAGTLRFGLPNRDIDLFCLAEQGAERNPAKSTEDVVVTSITVRDGWAFGFLKGKMRDGTHVSLCVLPAYHYHLQVMQYQQAELELVDPQQRELFLFMRTLGLKYPAYLMVGLRF